MNSLVQERIGTGRIYIMNMDNANTNTPFKERLATTNLCVETVLVVSPIKNIYDISEDKSLEHLSEGEIALCNLAGYNLGNIKNTDELYKCSEHLVRLLDFTIDHQDYPVNAARKMIKRRSLGIGVTNFAYWLAKQDLKYSDDSAIVKTDELFEHIQFSLLQAGVKLAKEFGPCDWFNKTTYSEGILPIDRYNKNVDNLIKREYSCD
jgi:ribonucleoside-diphosphate reductase alpha chain